MTEKFKEYLKCLGITIVIVAAIIILIVTMSILAAYSESLMGVLGLVAVVFIVVYASRNL